MTEFEATLVSINETGLTTQDPTEDVRDREVRDANGAKIGHVKDLLVDEKEQKVRLIEVAHGGLLGIGESRVLLPVDLITAIDDEAVYFLRDREQVSGAPKYDPQLVPEREYYDQLFGYYGVAPYWTAGYVYPAYPYLAPGPVR
ncbi:MAG TPA: PRC-barrel domain-containing protein [Devosia sp.]